MTTEKRTEQEEPVDLAAIERGLIDGTIPVDDPDERDIDRAIDSMMNPNDTGAGFFGPPKPRKRRKR